MPIPGISVAAGATTLGPISQLTPLRSPQTPVVDEAGGFGSKLIGAIDNLNNLHANADSMALQAATGDLTDVHEYTIAATEAQVATELTVAVRDKAVNAFNEIMRMQI